jgi:glycosyltransferase involved in cell wall biosynthesis
MDARPLLSIAIPVYNEQKVLPELVDRLSKVAKTLEARYRFEFVFVDDGSRDRSLQVAKNLMTKEPMRASVESSLGGACVRSGASVWLCVLPTSKTAFARARHGVARSAYRTSQETGL